MTAELTPRITAAEELQRNAQRIADLRREADLAAQLQPDLVAKATEEARQAVARGSAHEEAMRDELPDWQARHAAAVTAARRALAELVAVSESWNHRVTRYAAESSAAGELNAGAIARRGPVSRVTTGPLLLRLAVDALAPVPDVGPAASSIAIDVRRLLTDTVPSPRCVLDSREVHR